MGQTSVGTSGRSPVIPGREWLKVFANVALRSLALSILDVALVFPLTNVGREHCYELSDFTALQKSF